MPVLKDYSKHTTKSFVFSGSIPSGVKSGDSSNELMIVEPLKQHPEIHGLYRAIDPITGWMGWVEYEPEKVVKPPIARTQEEIKKQEYVEMFRELQKKKEQLEFELITKTQYDSFKEQVKTLGIEVGEI